MLMFLVLVGGVAVLLRRGHGIRLAVIRASIYWAVAATVSAELLGVFQQLGALPIRALWVALLVILSVYEPRWPLAIGRAATALGRWPRGMPLVSIVTVIFSGGTLITALVSEPNNWDSLTYHLTRVEHWIQNGTLAHYRTNVEQQIGLNPGAEILVLHARLLSGGDHYANMIQWVAYVVGSAAASLVAARLGATSRAQAIAGVFALTLPMGILQASSTQNDLVTACWVIVFAERLLTLRKAPSTIVVAEAAAALGLALVTKGTAMLAAFPLGCWLLVVLARYGPGPLLRNAAMAAAIVLTLNAGWWIRNYRVFGTPVGTIGVIVGNTTHGLDVAYSNAVRNLSSQLMTPSAAVNARIFEMASAAVRAAGVDPEAPGTTNGSFRTSLDVRGRSRVAHEDFAANPIHVVLLLGGMAWAVARSRRPDLIGYAVVVVAAALLYCVVLRWQVWCSRLHVPLFVLGAPIAGYALGALRPVALASASTALVIAGLPALLLNETRPLLPVGSDGTSVLTRSRATTMFANLPSMQRPYEEAALGIAKLRPRELGLILKAGSFEYPVWYLVRQYGEVPRLTHLRVAFDVPDPLGPSAPDVFLAIDVEPDLALLQEEYGPVREVGRWNTVVLLQRAER